MAVIYALLRVRLNNVQNVFVHQKSNHRRNRHYFSANGPFLLLPLALKWGLFILLAIVIAPCIMAKGAYAASLTVEVPQNPLSVTVSADGVAKESSQANVKVTSDAYWGYTLSVKSDSGEGSLISGTNRLKTTTDNAADLDNNSWGFKFGKDTVSGNYHKSPTATTVTQIDKTNGQTGGKEENSYAFTLGAKVDNTQAAGIYTGQFTFTLTANTVDYTINYYGNGGSGGPTTTTGESIEQTVQLASSMPTNNGKTFIGWCSQEPTDKGGCKGNVYYPSDNYTLSSSGNNLTLYALWDGIEMQNWEGCNTLRMSTTKQEYQITLIDNRDKKPYYVAKLADGNCWMTENLDFDIKATTYTSADTDLAQQSGYSWQVSAATHPTNETGASYWNGRNSSDGVQNTGNGENTPQSYDPGDYCWKIGEIYTTGISSNTVAENARVVGCSRHQTVAGSDPHYYIGNYYNYAAAVAQNDTSSKKSAGDHYDTSICPAGWQLPPNGTGNKSYQNLFNQAKAKDVELKSGVSGNVQNAPYWFGYSGLWRGVSYSIGYGAHYRSSAVSSATNSYTLYFNGTGYLNPRGSGGWRLDGFSVRCVAR